MNWYLTTFWLNFWIAALIIGVLGPKFISRLRRWKHLEALKADIRQRRRRVNDATVGWARDEARMTEKNWQPIMAANRRNVPAPAHVLSEGEVVELAAWRKSEERLKLLGGVTSSASAEVASEQAPKKAEVDAELAAFRAGKSEID